MGPSDPEDQIAKTEDRIAQLDPVVSQIYFDAKAELVNAQDSRTGTFAAAARVVRVFWRAFKSNNSRS
jgi:hypothetical protein